MFRWVHMSDLHIRDEDTYNEGQFKEKLPEFFRKEIGKVDALFLTGDFRFAKKSKGNPEATANFIKSLADALAVKAENVICVPGNHDLERSDIRTALLDTNSKQYNAEIGSFTKTFIPVFKQGFSFFAELEKALGHAETLTDREHIHHVKHLNQVDILMLNTAITAGRKDERGALLLGMQYLKQAIDELDPNKPVIMIGHHGHSFLDTEEIKKISLLLQERNISLYLCGHEHALWHDLFGQGIHQITSGCIYDDSGKFNVGFTSGSLNSKNEVSVAFHQWNQDQDMWMSLPYSVDKFTIAPYKKGHRLESSKIQNGFVLPKEYKAIPMKQYPFVLNGHTLLGGRGRDGIKYYWKKNGDRVESVAFNRRLCEPDPKHEAEDINISAYTISTSFGCVLSASNQQCRFCETGSRNFRGFLSAEEIALQAIFMANYDANCPSFPEVRNHKREFAFMGQGEPGLNYPAVREAIRLTDRAMEEIGQKVHRYIISTCGVTTFVPSLIEDIKRGVFKNRISLHFSLHGVGDIRSHLMPVDSEYSYLDFIKICKMFYETQKEIHGYAEKIGVGLLMFKNFIPIVRAGEVTPLSTTLDTKQLELILEELDPEIFRIDLSDFNHTSVTESSEEMSNEEAHALLECAEELGFEAKIFSSFGRDRHSGCGMLKSEYLDVAQDGDTTLKKYNESLELLHFVINKDKID